MGTILIGGKRYELIVDHKNGWNPSAFRDRYSDVLERYDYIIGDWGYNQLRLKGFFRDQHPKGNKDSFISGLVDYINEYCNFGCAYFVIQRHETSEQELADMNEPDLLLTPPSSSEAGGEDAVVALDENGDPIVLREHIRKPHPVRKEAPVRTERASQETGGRPSKNGAPSQRKDARISSDRKDAEDFGFDSGGDRRGGGQQRGERRGQDQRPHNGQSRGSDRSGGEQPRGGKQQRGGNERSGGEFRGKEQQSRAQEQRGGGPRSGGQQPRGGGNGGPRGEQQQRSGHPRGGQEQRGGGQQRFDSELPGPDGLPAEGRQRFKHRKGQKRLPIPPREQTVAATSEAALTQRPKPTGGDNGQNS
ncbi:hypothetical protein PCCS19_24310 [Paenibacillus sp. CCS19]|uniref:YutD-like domain-containing protein n=1 Tax=Paenibacillus sp. CCS19 TaxID=3158387 RepID=UPI002565C468|nr:YutD-like domain-containing protein [Paenibacillus cellulosilyticus]GMK39377.1 hypothetical protein PCCS19_24310 [Paenibacillus cellulosilyticus]